jgi:RND family efflux transporter MFP subunit
MYDDIFTARQQVHADYRRFYPRLFIALALLALLAACGESDALEADTSQPLQVSEQSQGVVPVRVSQVTAEVASEVLRFAGVARPRQRANLSFQVGGTIAARFAEIGERVQAGDIVARLYNPQLGPASQAAEARLAQLINDAGQAERDLTRLQHIYEQDLLASQDLEQQRTLLRSTQSAVDNARAIVNQNQQLQRESELRAPFDGRIEQVLLEPGEFAQPGIAVMRMSAEDGLEVEVQVPPRFLSGLSLGDSLPVWNGLSGESYQAFVTEIGAGSSRRSALYPLVVSLQHTSLRSGEAMEVGVTYQRGAGLSIPLNAVMRSAQGLTVFKVATDSAGTSRVSRVPVSVDRINGDRVQLRPGNLSAGDQVVYAGLTRLAEGDRIAILGSKITGMTGEPGGDQP